MRTVTALRPERRDRVRIELDGEPWRTVPAAAVVTAGLRVDAVLDRERARELRRALRRLTALDTAARALARRDRSRAELEDQLERRGIGVSEREQALEAMARHGYLDDDRFATGRARSLAGRGYGDEAIRADLDRRGLAGALIDAALAALEPEEERARAALKGGDASPRALRALLAKGFSPDTIEALVPPDAEEP